MALSIPDRVVVFDYGEVISRSPSAEDRAVLAETAGVARDDARRTAAFWNAYDRYRSDLDQGRLRIRDYWSAIADDLGTRFTFGQVQALWAADFRSWTSVEPGTIELIRELHEGGTRIAVLSNAGFDFGGPLRTAPVSEFFERVFVSAELDLLKPDPEIYRVACAQLGIEPERMVFVDNKRENTDAAAALGAYVHHFTGVEGLREFLVGLSTSSSTR